MALSGIPLSAGIPRSGIAPFTVARLPRIVFGAGRRDAIAAEAAAFGRQALVVTGARSLRASVEWPKLGEALAAAGIEWAPLAVEDEPSPQLVDDAVAGHRDRGIEVVIGIGGGSALDAAKAIAGLLPHGNSVMDHLEGVGRGVPYRGPSLPFIAVPTTAGTGSEATKNAVLSVRGGDGFKKSFRDESLVPRVAIVDPDLLRTCPQEVVAANGMDAFTQLLESYVSANASPFTDALAWSGMEAFAGGFLDFWQGDERAAAAGRECTAYAALMSGITLAQAGLGAVHGLASPLGAFFPTPHGAVCGTLVAESTAINIAALGAREPDNPALRKYAQVGSLMAGRAVADADEARGLLVDTLREMVETLQVPKLSAYGLGEGDVDRVVANARGGSMKTNPLVLTDDEIADLVRRRM
jgi:alcohol dehydrogenase